MMSVHIILYTIHRTSCMCDCKILVYKIILDDIYTTSIIIHNH